MSARALITEHLDLWTGAVTRKFSSGRGSNGKVELNGIKKLRELILELAVRGKLVDQIQEDEPSSELLKKIAAEKNKRIERGEIKKPKQLAAIDDAELPFQIPASWKFIRLGDAVDIIRGITFPASEKSKSPAPGRLACLRTTNVQDTIEVHDLLFIKKSFVTKNSQYIQKNDIVMSMANSRELVGKVAFVEEQPDEPMTFGGFLGVLRPTLIHPKFLMAVLRAPHSRATLIGNASQTTNIANISIGKLNPLVMGLPPIEEQHRIVRKVDELMALCDRLEQQTGDQLEAHETLVDTLLGTLTQSENATDLADNWARLAAHFDTLFTTEQSIDKLKQTILQLAVMGRLVAQDTGDEPVTVLLRKISEQKARVTNLDRAKTFSPISDSEQPFQLSSCWQFKRLGDLAHVFAGNSFKSQDFNNLSGSRVIKITNVGVGELIETPDFLPPEFAHEYSKYKVLTGDLILALTRPYISTGLKVAICPNAYNQALLNQRVAAIRPFLDGSFLYIYMQSKYVLGLYQARFGSSGLQPNLKMSDVTNLIIPVPPIAEQHRIVQKVDELMALCDQLKERLNQASETRHQLAEAVVEGALN